MGIFLGNSLISGESVESFNGRTGEIIPEVGDYTATMVGAAPDGFGLGDYSTDISNQDILTCCSGKSGFYRGQNVTNAPTNGWYSFFVAAGINSSYIIAMNNNYIYTSLILPNSSTSVDWKKYYNDGNPLTAKDVGAISIINAKNGEYDMDDIIESGSHNAIYIVGEKTLGTPAKYGVSGFNYGIIISTGFMNSSDQPSGQQLAILSGADYLVHRNLKAGKVIDREQAEITDGNWKRVYSQGYKPTPKDIGAVELEATSIEDANSKIQEAGKDFFINSYKKETLNTPNSAGLTRYATGHIITSKFDNSYGIQIGVPNGQDELFIRKQAGSGIFSDWKRVGAAPSLTKNQQDTLVSLANSYVSKRKYFHYENDKIRNSYTAGGNPFVSYGGELCTARADINCGLFCGLVWAGISPTTFTDIIDQEAAAAGVAINQLTQENVDNCNSKFTGDLIPYNGMDWGYQFIYPYRGTTYGVYKDESKTEPSEKYFGYRGRIGYNAHQKDGSSDIRFTSFATAADTANELYLKGCEIPLREVEPGDLVFYHAKDLSDGNEDIAETGKFRNITHVAFVTKLDKETGEIEVIESTTYEYYYIFKISNLDNTKNAPATKFINAWNARGAYLANHIIMAARHPAAFGVKTNLEEGTVAGTKKFTKI